LFLDYTNVILNFREEMGYISSTIFKGNILFENTLRIAFHHFLNKFINSPIYLAIYCDNDLKKSL